MKAIQPVTLWVNGQQQVANMFDLRIINDDLIGSATFYYELINQSITPNVNPDSEPQINNILLFSGNSTLQGQDYIDWGESADINNDAYQLVANNLNIVIV